MLGMGFVEMDRWHMLLIWHDFSPACKSYKARHQVPIAKNSATAVPLPETVYT
jgi:hypothetical protein